MPEEAVFEDNSDITKSTEDMGSQAKETSENWLLVLNFSTNLTLAVLIPPQSFGDQMY